jgi:tetratricopeptide (TPR) repeat protein
MTTTLIVRDATLAIHGAPEKRGEPREHLRLRIAEVAHLDPRTAAECVEVLGAVATGELADPEVLEALLILSLAHSRLAETTKLAPMPTGRRLATRLEREGEIDHAMAVLELLLAQFPGHEALERDMAQLMRRQGMVQDLVGRYFERAKRCIAEGRPSEAAGWLREVLQLDPGRKDAARLIRDLRFKKLKKDRKGGGGWKIVAVLLLLAGGMTLLVQRELALGEEFRALPRADEGSTSSLERRLATLENFVERNPVWHGSLGVLSERSELRVRLAALAEKARQEREAVEQDLRASLADAEQCRANGLLFAQNGDIAGAMRAFAEALEYGGPDWEHRERVERDLADLKHLSENP